MDEELASKEQRIKNAVGFLSDQRVRTSTLSRKVKFLTAKGLTAEDILTAYRRASITPQPTLEMIQKIIDGGDSGEEGTTNPQHREASTQPPATNAATIAPVAPALPLQVVATRRWDWKDYTMVALCAATCGYGMYSLIKRYFPTLLPSSRSDDSRVPPTAAASSSNALTSPSGGQDSAQAVALLRADIAKLETQIMRVSQRHDTTVQSLRRFEETLNRYNHRYR